jgi:predicted DNA-binding protein (MmcQ/YjbR family)
MDILEYREYALSLVGTTECTPFGDDTLVFKVMGKMFTYAGMDDFRWFNVKCDPDRAMELRERYADVVPGFHANKVHWNTVRTDGNLSDDFLKQQIRHSYDLVVAKLPHAIKEELAGYRENNTSK